MLTIIYFRRSFRTRRGTRNILTQRLREIKNTHSREKRNERNNAYFSVLIQGACQMAFLYEMETLLPSHVMLVSVLTMSEHAH